MCAPGEGDQPKGVSKTTWSQNYSITGKRKPPTLLVGMQAGAATLENNMEVPQEVENRATL